MATFVTLRHLVTILVTDFTNPNNFTDVLFILRNIGNKRENIRHLVFHLNYKNPGNFLSNILKFKVLKNKSLTFAIVQTISFNLR